MRMRAMILGVSILWLLTAGCGEPFAITGTGGSGTGTGGSPAGGAGGAGGTAMTGTTASASTASSSSSAGGMHGDACSPAKPNACATGLFCQTNDCMNGVCQPMPAPEGQQYSPVCGCNNLAYWNADLAIADGIAFRATCNLNDLANLVSCSKSNNPCPGLGQDIYCDQDASIVATTCSTPTLVKGACMKLPSKCDGTDRMGVVCPDKNNCSQACDLIRNEVVWTQVATCG